MVAIVMGCTLAIADPDSQQFKPWEKFDGKTSRGTQVCGLATAANSGSPRNISIKQLATNDFISVTLYQESWSFKPGSEVPIVLDFFDNQPLYLAAYGDGKILDITLPTDATAVFLSLLKDSAAMRVQIKNESEPDWRIPLKTVLTPLKGFLSCTMNAIKTQNEPKPPNAAKVKSCDFVRFTGLGATKFPYQIEDALKAKDLEDYVARDPIRCTRKNNACSGIGWFRSHKARVINEDGPYLHVITPVDFVDGRRDIYLAIRRADAVCEK